jgi:DNA polymerase III delta prime subunit
MTDSMDIFSGDGIDQTIKTTEYIKYKIEDTLPWVAKYTPERIEDIILPEKTRNMLNFALSQNKFTHFCFHSGKPGTGKTSTALAIPKEFGVDYQIFYISEKAMESIESIRSYAMQKNVDGKPRFIILDEADTPKIQDPAKFYTALQPLIESTTSTVRFILTCNNIYKIPAPILSRCAPISFAYESDDADIMKQIWKRVNHIVKLEVSDKGGKVNPDTLKKIARFYYPDIRSIIQHTYINYLENQGSIDGTPSLVSYENLDEIWAYITTFDDENLRKFTTKNIVDCTAIYSPFGKYVMEKIDKKFRLSFAVLLGQYQFQSSMPAVDQEINLNSFFARTMLLLQGK